ncbi:hypothetical protein KJ359_001693 [Pestalotiopsis sp. 9143b]|nr:hypothetical protein KJ359_001693 [Pestalotiopsis sp. 9143b]
MIQLSLLLAEYQLSMGRPNSAYLHLGVAWRKAFALGLHTATTCALTGGNECQARLTTLCCLEFYEIWLALVVGRKSMIRKVDIRWPFPLGQTTIVNLCRLMTVLEEGTGSIYGQGSDSFRKLHVVAEKTYDELHRIAQQCGIHSPTLTSNSANPVGSMQLQMAYYYSIMLTFRPFLVIESASQPTGASYQTGEIWLQQACRRAINAAQDCIQIASDMFRMYDVCKTKRYTSFLLEASVAVLLHDSLRRPSKHPHNMEYVEMAIKCLRSMVDDDPVSNAIDSLRKIVHVVEQAIARSPPAPTQLWDESDQTLAPSIQFPSLDKVSPLGTEDFIYFSDQNLNLSGALPEYPAASTGVDVDPQTFLDPFSNLSFDVVTTDLYNYFPVNIPTPGPELG